MYYNISIAYHKISAAGKYMCVIPISTCTLSVVGFSATERWCHKYFVIVSGCSYNHPFRGADFFVARLLGTKMQHSIKKVVPHLWYCTNILPIVGLFLRDLYPSKHGAFIQSCFNVGPPSSTLAQYWNSIGWMSRVCWDPIDVTEMQTAVTAHFTICRIKYHFCVFDLGKHHLGPEGS